MTSLAMFAVFAAVAAFATLATLATLTALTALTFAVIFANWVDDLDLGHGGTTLGSGIGQGKKTADVARQLPWSFTLVSEPY